MMIFISESHISHVSKSEIIILALINVKMFELTNQIKEGGAYCLHRRRTWISCDASVLTAKGFKVRCE